MMRQVYIARCLLTNGHDTGLLKIGVSWHVESRLSAIGQLIPFDFEIIGLIDGGLVSERVVQILLREHCARGEFFWATPECMRLIEQMVRDGRPHPLISDREDNSNLEWVDRFCIKHAADKLRVDFSDVAAEHGVSPAYLRRSLVNGYRGTRSRTLAAATCVAAARKGVRSVWPRDFVPAAKQQGASA